MVWTLMGWGECEKHLWDQLIKYPFILQVAATPVNILPDGFYYLTPLITGDEVY